jgi:putative NADH-flavin reductase
VQLTVFGATRGTGRLLVQSALARGYKVTALVRDAAQFDLRDRCRVVVGDARDPAAVSDAVAGAQAVVSTLGAKTPFEKSDLLARAAPAIVQAMQANGVRRLVVLGAGGWQPDALRHQSGARRWLFDVVARTLLKRPIEAQRAQEAAVVPSPLDWTIVAPTRLVDSAAHGNVRIDTEALPPRASQVARADVAAVMLRALEEQAWVRQHVYVTW